MRISDWSSDVCSSDLHVVYDAMLITMIASVIAAAVLFAFPQALFPNSSVNGMDRLLPLIILAVAGSDVALAACAYRYDIAATVRARSIVEPWPISIEIGRAQV